MGPSVFREMLRRAFHIDLTLPELAAVFKYACNAPYYPTEHVTRVLLLSTCMDTLPREVSSIRAGTEH
jgi:hypothetical protein